MFDIGWSEILVIVVITILVVGPKELPGLLRTVGKTVGNMRRMAGDFQNQFNEALREADLEDVKNTIGDVRKLNPSTAIKDAVVDQLTSVEEMAAELDAISVQDEPKEPAKVIASSASPDEHDEQPSADDAHAVAETVSEEDASQKADS